MNTDIILEIKNLDVNASTRAILKNISFNLKRNEIVTVVGPSGAGKSTLLRVLNRLAGEDPGITVKGDILFNGEDIFTFYRINELRRRIGMVFQKPCVFPGSIYRNVLFGARHHKTMKEKDKNILVESMLRRSHLWEEVKERLKEPASKLSIGEKQRLVFARTLAVDPEILLLDEPTSSLDPHSTIEIEKALNEMKSAKSIIVVTHILDQAKRLSGRVIFLSSGKIVEEGPADEIFNRPVHEETKRYFSR